MSQNCVWNVPRCSGRMERRGFVTGLVPDLMCVWNMINKYIYMCVIYFIYVWYVGYICVCIYDTHMYIYINTNIYVWYIYMDVYMTHTYVYTYICMISVYIYIFVCMYKWYTFIYIYIYTYVCYIYICMYKWYIYINVCVWYIYIYMHVYMTCAYMYVCLLYLYVFDTHIYMWYICIYMYILYKLYWYVCDLGWYHIIISNFLGMFFSQTNGQNWWVDLLLKHAFWGLNTPYMLSTLDLSSASCGQTDLFLWCRTWSWDQANDIFTY